MDDIFSVQDAPIIKALPVYDDFEDFWAWHPAPNGQFLVKTAYKLFRADMNHQIHRGLKRLMGVSNGI